MHPYEVKFGFALQFGGYDWNMSSRFSHVSALVGTGFLIKEQQRQT